jgi:hypothetical protein
LSRVLFFPLFFLIASVFVEVVYVLFMLLVFIYA